MDKHNREDYEESRDNLYVMSRGFPSHYSARYGDNIKRSVEECRELAGSLFSLLASPYILDPPIVRFARSGNLDMVQALYFAGFSIHECSRWFENEAENEWDFTAKAFTWDCGKM
jgi:hypothetical protein